MENKNVYVPATEYASGFEYYVCDRCGDVLVIKINNVSNGNTKHSFQKNDGSLDPEKGVRTKEPTCTEEGEMTFTCDDCETTITLPIPAKGHSYSEEFKIIEHVDSGCTVGGHNTYARVCSVCGANDDAGKVKINLPALGHILGPWQNADTTTRYLCTDEREQIRYCTREGCDDINSSIERRLGGETKHIWDNNISCRVCGYVSNGHNINYITNGGSAPESLIELAEKAYKPGDTKVLW